MTTDRFHKAAKDGLLEVLREATKKECNNKDESGMTPTLWAAFEGHVEALRLLCGRGFPFDINMRQKWINAIARDNWEWKKQHRICSKHFSDDCFINTDHKWRRLKLTAVPSLLPRKEEFMSTERYDSLKVQVRQGKRCSNSDVTLLVAPTTAIQNSVLERDRHSGEPDKADYFGNTALHLAAARGHKECVTFLVNFGANVYAMDVDGHTAQELAAINGRDDILRHLDQATGKLENIDKKKAKSLKEKAKKDHEKSHKQFQKRQSKAEIMAEKELKKLAKEWEQGYGEEISTIPHRPSTVIMALKQKIIRSNSQGNLLADDQPRPTYSALVGTVNSGARGRGAVYKKALANKLRNGTLGKSAPVDDFKVGEVETTTGRRSVTSLSGLRRDSEVMYVGTFGAGQQQRTAAADVFAEVPEPAKPPLTRSLSQPDFAAPPPDESGIGQEVLLQEPASIFDRPGFGSVAFRRSITATLGTLPPAGGEELSIGSAGSLAARHAYQPVEWNSAHSESSTITSDEEGDAEESPYASLERFLAAWGLSQYANKFKDEQIDLDALMLLTEGDMKSLGLPLGPYRKLVTAVHERKQAVAHPGAIVDTAI